MGGRRPTVVLGTANFTTPYSTTADQGGLNKSQCKAILDAAWDMGVEWVDTARSYGDAEKIIAAHPSPFRVISKGDTSDDYKKSSSTLHKKLEIYLQHHWKPNRPVFDGISLYDPDDCSQIPRHDKHHVCFPLNLIDQRWAGVECGWAALRIARSVFIQGLAWGMPDIGGVPFAHLCWNFIMHHPNIDMVVVGVDDPDQLYAILDIPDYKIDYQELRKEGGTWLIPYV